MTELRNDMVSGRGKKWNACVGWAVNVSCATHPSCLCRASPAQFSRWDYSSGNMFALVPV